MTRVDEASAFKAHLSAALAKPYRILVTGSRDWDDWNTLTQALTEEIRRVNMYEDPADGLLHCREVVIVHGGCPTGADEMANTVALSQGVTIEVHKADWRRYGKSAGPRRNAEMVQAGANKCLAFIKNGSPGAVGCAALARGAGIRTIVRTPR